MGLPISGSPCPLLLKPSCDVESPTAHKTHLYIMTYISCTVVTATREIMLVYRCQPQDDADQRPFVSRVINKLANYNGGMIQNTEQEPIDEPGDANDATTATPGGKKKKKKKAPSKKVPPLITLFQTFQRRAYNGN